MVQNRVIIRLENHDYAFVYDLYMFPPPLKLFIKAIFTWQNVFFQM